ncbi:hypothetical protein G7Y89_g7466 [Cudoniella acicularis]|uniref:Uncharacterized protein n=1 Tax=Cudoniella acicularis TaxID=354080 RepID=A0A8H4W1Y0_9HELO|nr:hypothetical protein G7Y89_g7466 [Cudoniella acicularis]
MYFSISPSAPSTSYSTASPMDIPSSSSRSQSQSCAYPSWPRRSSLSSNSSCDEEYHNRSFIISDEELFPGVFDDAESDYSPLSTPSSNTSRSPASPTIMREPQIVVDHGTLMRELVAQEKMEKRRRRRSANGSSKKSRSASGGSKRMSPIQEAVE